MITCEKKRLHNPIMESITRNQAVVASGHVVDHEPTCSPDTKARHGGGGECKKENVSKRWF